MRRRRLAIAVAATLLGGAGSPAGDGFDRALAALIAGSRAAASGRLADLRTAALALRSSAAQPVAGVDLAAEWLAQAHAAPPPETRDRALGPGYRSLQLTGGDAATFEQTFLAGQRARVAVMPQGRATFVMRVREEASAPVCSASPRHMLCDWIPIYTSRFTIEIVNTGSQPGRYVVMMQ